MESNFIKERVVTRKEIIEKNFTKKTGKQTDLKEKLNTIPEVTDKVIVLEELINEKLKKDLANIVKREEEIAATIADYLKVKSAIYLIKQNPRKIRLQTNLGCDFYAQCLVHDATKIYVSLGLDYYLYVELDEAIKLIKFKECQLNKELEKLQERASKIKAYIKIALETLGNICRLDET